MLFSFGVHQLYMVPVYFLIAALWSWLSMIHRNIYRQFFWKIVGIWTAMSNFMVQKQLQRKSTALQRQLIEVFDVVLVDVNGRYRFKLGRDHLVWTYTTVFEDPFQLEVHSGYVSLGVFKHFSRVAEFVEQFLLPQGVLVFLLGELGHYVVYPATACRGFLGDRGVLALWLWLFDFLRWYLRLGSPPVHIKDGLPVLDPETFGFAGF